MRPKEFVKFVLNNASEEEKINEYITSVVGLPTFNQLNNYRLTTKYTPDQAPEMYDLIKSVPPEIAWFYSRSFYLYSLEFRSLLDDDIELLEKIAETREMPLSSVHKNKIKNKK